MLKKCVSRRAVEKILCDIFTCSVSHQEGLFTSSIVKQAKQRHIVTSQFYGNQGLWSPFIIVKLDSLILQRGLLTKKF